MPVISRRFSSNNTGCTLGNSLGNRAWDRKGHRRDTVGHIGDGQQHQDAFVASRPRKNDDGEYRLGNELCCGSASANALCYRSDSSSIYHDFELYSSQTDARKAGKMSRHTKDSILKGVIYLCAFLCVAVLFWLIGYVVISGLPHLSLDFLIKDYHPDNTGGIFPMVVTTLYLIGTSLLIATPLGICSAIYLTEYAKQGRLVSIIRFATESLSGIPSIIYGLFGMLFFVTTLKMGFSIMAGAATVSIMILPTIIRTTEEAIKAVPVGYREGAFA